MVTPEELAAENEALRARIESMKIAAEEQMANMASLYIAFTLTAAVIAERLSRIRTRTES